MRNISYKQHLEQVPSPYGTLRLQGGGERALGGGEHQLASSRLSLLSC